MKSLIPIRGTHLYVEDHNKSNEEVLLYLHGGPGASCVDFCYQQAGALSINMRVVAFDQRGVLRSHPIQEGEQFGIQDIIEDCEALRVHLGIKGWNILGHSFGGYIALLYALQHPNSVKKVIFEIPSFDIKRSMKSLITKALTHFQSIKHDDGIRECNKYLEGIYIASDLWNAWGEIIQLLGNEKDSIYFHGIEPQLYIEIVDNLVESSDLWSKNQQHVLKLQTEGKFFEDLTPKLSNLSQPTLLITGKFDPVCCEEQQSAYRHLVQNCKVVQFNNSGHIPRIEEPDKYTREVITFICSE
jgi:proline iminopeptidase